MYCAITQAAFYNLYSLSLSNLGTPCVVTRTAIPMLLLDLESLWCYPSCISQVPIYTHTHVMLVSDLPPLSLIDLCVTMLLALFCVAFRICIVTQSASPMLLPNLHISYLQFRCHYTVCTPMMSCDLPPWTTGLKKVH